LQQKDGEQDKSVTNFICGKQCVRKKEEVAGGRCQTIKRRAKCRIGKGGIGFLKCSQRGKNDEVSDKKGLQYQTEQGAEKEVLILDSGPLESSWKRGTKSYQGVTTSIQKVLKT